MVLLDSFDDDGPAVPPPPSAEMPPLVVPAGAEMWRRWQTREAMAAVPETARATPAAVTRTTTVVPKTTRVTPVVVAEATSQRGIEAPANSATK